MDLALLLSKILSYGIIVGALVVKMPQILKIVNNRSVKGLVLFSYWTETIGYDNYFLKLIINNK